MKSSFFQQSQSVQFAFAGDFALSEDGVWKKKEKNNENEAELLQDCIAFLQHCKSYWPT